MKRSPPGGQQLGSVRAVIAFGPSVWPEVWIVDEKQLADEAKSSGVGIPNELFVGLTREFSLDEGGPRPHSYPEHFWRELLDRWLPIFREPSRNKPAIGYFYEQFGPVTAFGTWNDFESLEAARLAIEWLAALANIVRWLKDERYGPLWDWFKTPIERRTRTVGGLTQQSYFRADVPGDEPFEIVFYDHFSQDRPEGWVADPKTNEELATEGWGAVKNAVWDRLQHIPLAPIRSDFNRPKEPVVLWGFEARGALNAAFLQWFFEELANISLPKCEGCDNIIPPGRERWCSTTCRNRVYKQKQRAKNRRG